MVVDMMKRILSGLFILLLSACFPFKSTSTQNQPKNSSNRALVTGTWNGVSVSSDGSLSTNTRFVLVQEGDRLKGEFYLQGNDRNSLTKYGDVQGAIQQGAWGQPLQTTMVIHYTNHSYTQYTGTFIGDVFQGQYQYLENDVVQAFGQVELSLAR